MRQTKARVERAARKRSPRSSAKSGANRISKSVAVPQKPIIKRDQLIALLVRDEGATIEEMCKATGWLPHTVRAALTGLKKLGYAIDSDKVDGVRTYRAVVPR